MKLIVILLVALYSHSSDAKSGDNDPSDPCQYKSFNCERLDGKRFDILRTNSSKAWLRFKAANRLIYSDSAEEAKRKSLFENCLADAQSQIRSCNSGTNKDCTHNRGLSPLCILTDEERAKRNGAKTPPKIIESSTGNRKKRSYSSSSKCQPANITLPASYDARNLSQVTPVKDQGNCGSCWTFSTTAATEHQYLKLTGRTKDGAEQQLVNCAQSTNGCNGGDPSNALTYIQNKGSPPETTVPYTASYSTNTCSLCPISNQIKIQDWCMWGGTWCYSNGTCFKESVSVSLIMRAIYKYGSAVLVMDATNLTKGSAYTGGIYSYSGCTTNTNHAVLAVGWGTQNGTNYWIVKNSWGSSWGESGYFRIVRGVNMCGIEGQVWWPIISNTTLNTKSC